MKDVEEWLKLQLAYTLHRPIRLNFKTRPVVVHQIDEQWEIDLVEMSKLSKWIQVYYDIYLSLHG